MKSRAVSGSFSIAHSGEPTCPRSSETIDVTHSANCTSTGGKPKGISKVIEIWKMLGKAMLLMMAVLEMRATDLTTCAAAFASSLNVSASSRSDALALASPSWTAETFQTRKMTAPMPTSAASPTGSSSSSDSGHGWQVAPCGQRH